MLRAALHPAHCDTAARDHRMGFATSFRRRSFPWLQMVRTGANHRLLDCLPVQASAECCQLALCALSFSFSSTTQPKVPAGWEAVNKTMGAQDRGTPTSRRIQHGQTICRQRFSSRMRPCSSSRTSASTHWNESTDAFWGDTLTALASQHRTVLMGAESTHQALREILLHRSGT